MLHSFLLIGQSNMAGRGYPGEVEPIVNPQVRMLRNGRFIEMFVPVNPDRSFSGVCLGESFADAYANEQQVFTGLIPCADGGTTLEQWSEGSVLFDHACYQAELASRSSEIKGILWHQGESDCSEALYPTYGERLSAMIDALRRRLGLGDIPFIMGGLGDFLAKGIYSPELVNYRHINEAMMQLASAKKNCGFVSAAGLASNPDELHFSAAALREFGMRYYREFKRVAAPQGACNDRGSSVTELSAMERL
jgi:hypothetical protein